jgi:hypothetical protein
MKTFNFITPFHISNSIQEKKCTSIEEYEKQLHFFNKSYRGLSLLVSTINDRYVVTSVVDPDPVRSDTFCRIRNKSFRIRIRAALTRNEYETKKNSQFLNQMLN